VTGAKNPIVSQLWGINQLYLLGVYQMTPEERLSQAEVLLETAARYINRHSESIAQHEENINRLNLQMLQLTDLYRELAVYMRESREQMQRNQERMEQHQVEIERLWQYLTGQQGNGRTD
jgi:chromosome segregation ATPase